MDLNQNMMLNQSLGFIYSPLIEAQLKDVVFSEIYFENSSVSPLPNSEFIEIYNRRDSSIILSGWKISDGSSDGLIPEFNLAPHSYAVLYDEDDSTDFHSIPNALAVSSFPSLNNDFGDHLVLSDVDGVIIDDLKFNDSYYHDNNKNDGGWTIEKIDPDFICDNVENWKASVSNLHGSPGLVNSINNIFSDSSSPFVENVFVTDTNLVTVIFSEVISEGIIDINNYKFTGSDGIIFNPQFILQWSDDSIGLILSNKISNGIYTLTITDALKDCPGNSMDYGTAVRFGMSENSNINDIIINELLYNSSSGGNDFVELYNRSQKIIDLNDWIIAEAGYDDSLDLMEYTSITVEHKLIFPGDYLVITEEEKKVKDYFTCLNQHAFLNVGSMPDFNSEEGRVILFDQNGSAIDALQYSDKMHFALLAETKGITLERLSFSESGINSNNWHSAAATAGFGTPGYVNSQQQDLMLVDDEVSIGVEIFSPDNDGYNDVLPIHYKFPKAGTMLSLIVYDLNGLPVRTLLPGETVNNEGVINWDGLTDNLSIASAGIYIILAKSFDLDGNEKAFKKACFLTRLY